jgi:hypothetical protein
MSKKRSTHLRGERGQAFADLIRGTPAEQLLCVSLDISKYFHVAMIHNGLGEIVTSTFEVDIYQSGFDQLCQVIEQAKTRTQAQVVLVGMEPTSHYFENLARHLLQCYSSVCLTHAPTRRVRRFGGLPVVSLRLALAHKLGLPPNRGAVTLDNVRGAFRSHTRIGPQRLPNSSTYWVSESV